MMNDQKSKRSNLLDSRQASKYLGLKNGTLSVWRSTGRYQIPFVKIGSKVRYRESDLDEWLESRTHKATL